MSYTLVEPCAGSAALTFHLLGATQSVLPYQGSKWRYRHALQAVAESMGFAGSPDAVVLVDPGPWGSVLAALLSPIERPKIVRFLEWMEGMDPKGLFDLVDGKQPGEWPTAFSAEFLFLQRLAFSGKAVDDSGGAWRSPGFNATSAYGVAATERFGAVSPMLGSLIRTLKSHRRLKHVPVTSLRVAVEAQAMKGRTLVYLDPPYAGTTAYPAGVMDRSEVVATALAWQASGASVIVSETEGLDLPGWKRQRLTTGRSGASPFKGRQEEWVTFTGE